MKSELTSYLTEHHSDLLYPLYYTDWTGRAKSGLGKTHVLKRVGDKPYKGLETYYSMKNLRVTVVKRMPDYLLQSKRKFAALFIPSNK